MRSFTSNRNNYLTGVAFAAILAALSPPTYAQISEATDSSAGSFAEEIFVTARRTSERLQDVPLSISAISAETLLDRQIVDLRDVAAYTPGLQFREFVSVFNGNVTIRGLAQANVQNAVANAGVFVDGVYLQRGYMANFSLSDIERIEVVKGPQSALYGENTFSGAINVVTKKPTQEWAADGSLTVGNAGRLEYRAGIGGPIVKDLLSFRAFYGKSEFDGTIENNFPGITGDLTDFGGFDREAYSFALRVTPTERLSIDASYQRLDRSEEIRASYTADGSFVEHRLNCGPINATSGGPSLLCGTVPTDFSTLLSGVGDPPENPSNISQPPVVSETEIYRVGVEWNPIDPVTLYYTFGKTKGAAQENLSLVANAFNPTGRFGIAQQKEGGTLDFESHEVRLTYDDGGPLTGEVGYYNSSVEDQFIFGLSFFAANTPLVQASDDPISTDGVALVFNNRQQSFETNAGFARVSYDFMDEKATIAAEGRYQTTDVSLNDVLARTADPTLPLLEDSFTDFTPRVTGTYRITPDNSVYVSAARGIKAGGFNGYVTGGTLLLESEQSFEQERNWTYELGTKNTFFDGSLVLNATLFYISWSNQQIRVVPENFPTDSIEQGSVPPAIFAAAGDATNWGFELEGLYRATEELTFNYTFAYNDPKYKDGSVDPAYINLCDDVVCSSDGDISGNNIPGSPRVAFTVGADYERDLGNDYTAFAGADVSYRGKQFLETVNISQISAITLVNARLGVERGPIRASLFVKNLTDENYLDSAFTIPSILQVVPSYGERRTFGATISFNY